MDLPVLLLTPMPMVMLLPHQLTAQPPPQLPQTTAQEAQEDSPTTHPATPHLMIPLRPPPPPQESALLTLTAEPPTPLQSRLSAVPPNSEPVSSPASPSLPPSEQKFDEKQPHDI